MRTAFLFPGEGSHYVGMGSALHDVSAGAADLFARADEVVGFDLSGLCFEGPETHLRLPENSQPALFVVGTVGHAVLRERGMEPEVVAGHGVGEYTALHGAGAIGFEDALLAVRRRGELMASAVERGDGAMGAVLGLSVAEVEELCAKASSSGAVTIAAENGPEHIVVSGDRHAVDVLLQLADGESGAATVTLPVDGAFNSPSMLDVASALEDVLAPLEFRLPRIPVIANVSANIVSTPEQIRRALIRQVAGRVLWRGSIDWMISAGVTRLIDVGPGRTLAKLAKRRTARLTISAVDDLFPATRPGETR